MLNLRPKHSSAYLPSKRLPPLPQPHFPTSQSPAQPYQTLTFSQIYRQHLQLRSTLKALNSQLNHLLENRLDKLQPESDKPKTDEHLLIEKQIECNEGAMSVMKVELLGLERRREEVEQRGREQLWRDAVQVQAAVEVIKKEIRVIKRDAIRRSRQYDEPTLIRQMKELTEENMSAKLNLQQKELELSQSFKQLHELQGKIKFANSTYQQGTKLFVKLEQKWEKQASQQRQINLVGLKKSQIRAMKQKLSKMQQQKEKLYLVKLMELEKCIGSIRKTTQHINSLQSQTITTTNIIEKLDRMVRKKNKASYKEGLKLKQKSLTTQLIKNKVSQHIVPERFNTLDSYLFNGNQQQKQTKSRHVTQPIRLNPSFKPSRCSEIENNHNNNSFKSEGHQISEIQSKQVQFPNEAEQKCCEYCSENRGQVYIRKRKFNRKVYDLLRLEQAEIVKNAQIGTVQTINQQIQQ